jgi:hypothetical protein
MSKRINLITAVIVLAFIILNLIPQHTVVDCQSGTNSIPVNATQYGAPATYYTKYHAQSGCDQPSSFSIYNLAIDLVVVSIIDMASRYLLESAKSSVNRNPKATRSKRKKK